MAHSICSIPLAGRSSRLFKNASNRFNSSLFGGRPKTLLNAFETYSAGFAKPSKIEGSDNPVVESL